MLNSAKAICSSEDLFNEEVDKLKKMFAANGYPKLFFDKTLEKFTSAQSKMKSDNPTDLDVSQETDRKYMLGIPWVGNASREYRKKIKNLIEEHLKVDISFYYSSCKVSSFFSLKSATPHALKARVVYKFTCLSDSDTYYIGKTKRHLATRAMEHITPKESTQSQVQKHIFGCNGCKNGVLSVDNFSTVKNCRSDYSAKINEALVIKKFRPRINKQQLTKDTYLLRIF